MKLYMILPFLVITSIAGDTNENNDNDPDQALQIENSASEDVDGGNMDASRQLHWGSHSRSRRRYYTTRSTSSSSSTSQDWKYGHHKVIFNVGNGGDATTGDADGAHGTTGNARGGDGGDSNVVTLTHGGGLRGSHQGWEVNVGNGGDATTGDSNGPFGTTGHARGGDGGNGSQVTGGYEYGGGYGGSYDDVNVGNGGNARTGDSNGPFGTTGHARGGDGGNGNSGFEYGGGGRYGGNYRIHKKESYQNGRYGRGYYGSGYGSDYDNEYDGEYDDGYDEYTWNGGYGDDEVTQRYGGDMYMNGGHDGDYDEWYGSDRSYGYNDDEYDEWYGGGGGRYRRGYRGRYAKSSKRGKSRKSRW